METEEEFSDYGSAPGCAIVYGALLALAGAVLILYLLVAGLPAPLTAVADGGGLLRGALLLLGLLGVGLGAGLLWDQTWAWWLVLLLHSLGALAGLAIALLPVLGLEIGGRRLPGLVTPATALMGVVVNVVVVAWIWRQREAEDAL